MSRASFRAEPATIGSPQHNQRGVSESAQWAVLMPTLLLVLLGCLQVGLSWHGRSVAAHAAASAAELESALRARPGESDRVAHEIASAGGLDQIQVQVRRSAARAEVRVSGRMPLLVDLGMAEVSQSATAPLEKP